MSKAETVIKAALGSAVREAINQSSVPATIHEAEAIVRDTVAEVAPVIAHATNNEPWFQSRVIIGNVVAIMLAVTGVVGLLRAGVTDVEVYSVPIGAILANGFSLYGRLIANKPLGR